MTGHVEGSRVAFFRGAGAVQAVDLGEEREQGLPRWPVLPGGLSCSHLCSLQCAWAVQGPHAESQIYCRSPAHSLAARQSQLPQRGRAQITPQAQGPLTVTPREKEKDPETHWEATAAIYSAGWWRVRKVRASVGEGGDKGKQSPLETEILRAAMW